ncbi:MAG TPA: hypothetical protein VMV07_03770 [Streptosporangiaceae bacterium]|nr:hypothetical protein [Streptosporangiaceae bacterium]
MTAMSARAAASAFRAWRAAVLAARRAGVIRDLGAGLDGGDVVADLVDPVVSEAYLRKFSSRHRDVSHERISAGQQSMAEVRICGAACACSSKVICRAGP